MWGPEPTWFGSPRRSWGSEARVSVASSGVGGLRVVTWNVEWAAHRKRSAIVVGVCAVPEVRPGWGVRAVVR